MFPSLNLATVTAVLSIFLWLCKSTFPSAPKIATHLFGRPIVLFQHWSHCCHWCFHFMILATQTYTHMAFTHLPTFHLYAFSSLIVFCTAIFLHCINSTFAIIDLLEIHLNPGIYTIWLQAWDKKKIRRRRRKGRDYDFTITQLRLCVPNVAYEWHTGHSTPHSTHHFFYAWIKYDGLYKRDKLKSDQDT